jgi:carboxypeptidase family protein
MTLRRCAVGLRPRLPLPSWLVAITLVACSDSARDPTGVGPRFHRDDNEGRRTVPVVAQITLTVVDPGDTRLLPDGSVRVRRQRQQGPISGDLASTATDGVKIRIEKATIAQGSGPAKGWFTITACHTDLGCGTFKGRFEGMNTALLLAGEFQGRGTSGDFDEMRFSGTFTETTPTSNVFAITGTIQADDEGDDEDDEDDDDDEPPPPPPPPPPTACSSPPVSPAGTQSISGTVFNSSTGAGLSGWCVEITATVTATGATVTAKVETDASGDYTFTGLPPATYTICEVVQSGWTQTSPQIPAPCSSGFGYQFELLAGESAFGASFGNMRL